MPSQGRVALAVVCLLLLSGCTQSPPPTEDKLPGDGETSSGNVTALARNLDTPWEVAFSDDGRVFVTERPGRIQVVEDGQVDLWREMPGTVERGESGLMGLALHPDFPSEAWVYACQTHRSDEGELENRVIRVREEAGSGGTVETLLRGIDASSIHDGCRLGFGPQGFLYVTMGDGSQASRAQDETSPNGKVLRMTASGEPAGVERSGWHGYVYTLGHRNPQGLAFHPDSGTPYISEHGPENHDEVNVLEAGDNYGWPQTRGEDDSGSFHPAIWSSGPDGTVAPAGAAFIQAEGSPLDGAFAFATLKEAQLHLLELTGPEDREVEDEHVVFDGRFGRLRAATWHDGALYLSTSNDDGRGTPGPNDDRIVRVPLGVLEAQVR